MDKSSINMPEIVNFVSFWKPEVCGQTVLTDRSLLIGQKMVESAKIEKFKYSNATFLVILKHCVLWNHKDHVLNHFQNDSEHK